ncbi:hypothetical protein BDW22DRAFT_1363238 [Trametopsis cervina]|nr:hypothetical protein BDW22DRAFT_1363238 [Trametopsis cervina]
MSALADTEPERENGSPSDIILPCKPIVSVRSKAFIKTRLAGDDPNAGSSIMRRTGRHQGKLAHLMDMPMDIFLEVMAFLHPLDLLHLSRVSRSFRKILLHRSSRLMWVAARRNANNPPDPPSHLSEPKYAALVFEHSCMACGVPRAGKVDYAMSVRFCGPCWKENVSTGNVLMRNPSTPRSVAMTLFSLLPTHIRIYAAPARSQFYISEFDAVAGHYKALSEEERESFVKDREALVETMSEHATAVLKWEDKMREDRQLEAVEISKNREQSIEAKLEALGYHRSQWPRSDSQWKSLVHQPRELTPRIWKQILPKLEAAIKSEIARQSQQELTRRKAARGKEVTALYKAYVDALPAVHDLILPPCSTLCGRPAVVRLIEDNEARHPVTPELFDLFILPEIKNYALEVSSSLEAALQPTSGLPFTQSPEPGLGSATALFYCIYPRCGTQNLYSYAELAAHIRLRHTSYGDTHHYRQYTASRTSAVLRKIGLSDDVPYAEINRKVICLCGKPDFEQPATFSALMEHIESEYDWFEAEVKARNHRFVEFAQSVFFRNDHDLLSNKPFLRLLSEGETYEPPHIPEPDDDFFSYTDYRCTFCALTHYTDVCTDSLEVVMWHVRAKHGQAPCRTNISSVY